MHVHAHTHTRARARAHAHTHTHTHTRTGPLSTGHDYLDNVEVQRVSPNQDWSVCGDGTVNKGAVRGAVDEFAQAVKQPVLVTTHDGPWRSWIIMKPRCRDA